MSIDDERKWTEVIINSPQADGGTIG